MSIDHATARWCSRGQHWVNLTEFRTVTRGGRRQGLRQGPARDCKLCEQQAVERTHAPKPPAVDIDRVLYLPKFFWCSPAERELRLREGAP